MKHKKATRINQNCHNTSIKPQKTLYSVPKHSVHNLNDDSLWLNTERSHVLPQTAQNFKWLDILNKKLDYICVKKFYLRIDFFNSEMRLRSLRYSTRNIIEERAQKAAKITVIKELFEISWRPIFVNVRLWFFSRKSNRLRIFIWFSTKMSRSVSFNVSDTISGILRENWPE